MAANVKVADTHPSSAQSEDNPKGVNPMSTAAPNKSLNLAEKSDRQAESDERKDNVVAQGQLSPRLAHIAPGSARKTGRPVGKEYVENLLAHMQQQGQAIGEQVKKVLQIDGDDQFDRGSPYIKKDTRKSKDVDKSGVPAASAPLANGEDSNQEKGTSSSSSTTPVLLLVSSPPAANVAGPPKLYLATVNSSTKRGSDPSDVESVPTLHQANKGATASKSGTPPLETGRKPGNDEDAPRLTPMIDPRVSLLMASESESGTSQSENEGVDEPGGKKRRRGSRKRRKANGQREQAAVKDGGRAPPEQTKAILDDAAGGNATDAAGSKRKGLPGAMEGGEEKNAALPTEPEGVQESTDGLKEGSVTSSSVERNKDQVVKKPCGALTTVTSSAEGNNLDVEAHMPDSDKTKNTDKDGKEAEGNLYSGPSTKEQVISGSVPPMKHSLTAKLALKQNRPKRNVKHKFLESSDVYEHEPSKGAHRGRARGRSLLSGIVVKRRGSRGRGGGMRGRGTRGRGMGRGGRGTRGKGRTKWTRPKIRKVYPMPTSGEEQLQTVTGKVPETSLDSSQKISPKNVPKRGGFRGSRRRGSMRRGGYRNVANRTLISSPKMAVEEKVTEAVVINHENPVLPVVADKIIPPSGNENKDTKATNESPPVVASTPKDSAAIPDPQEVPEPQEVPANLTKTCDPVIAPAVERFPIPFASIRGKARKSYKSKNNTHFGQRKLKRKLKHKTLDASDPTKGQMGPPVSKRPHHTNSESTADSEKAAEKSPEREVRTTHTGRMAPPASTPLKSASSWDHSYGMEPPLCCCKLVQDKPITAIANSCEALEIVNGKVAMCTYSVTEAKVMRPSSRIPFRGLCQRHKTWMKEHKCCPGCGCFCTTGLTMVCTIDGADHYFHKECIREIDEALYCPHCGEDAKLAKEVILPDLPEMVRLEVMPESVLLSHQRVKLPITFLAALMGLTGEKLKIALEGHAAVKATEFPPRARMEGKFGSPKRTMSPVMPETPPHQDESVFCLQLKNGRTLSSGLLPPGPSRESLEMAMKFMDPENPRRLRFAPKNLYMASSLGEIEKVLQMLGEGFDPNYHFPAHNRETPVHAACAKGHLDIVCMLFQAGANLDAEDIDHRTPLHLAVEKEQLGCVKFLCRHGARPDHKDDDGTAVVHIATVKGNKDILKYLLTRKTSLINTQDNGGWTPIIWAADNKNADLVNFLLDQGADPNIRDKELNIALHWAAYSGCEEVMEALMNHCSFMEGLVNAVNMHGDTPLHVAARENNFGCVTQLLMRKADPRICNKEGDTPLNCARKDSDVWLSIETNLRIDVYVQKRNLRTERILSRDICRGRENIPIPVINSIDDEPLPNNFLYVADNCETSQLDIDRNIKHMQGCHCDDDCSTGNCPCGQSSVRCWYSAEGHLAEDFNYQEPPLLFECGTACHCWVTCRNRVVQNGIKAHLQLFRTPRMGWGLRTTHDIPKGSFICQYAGELISDAEADKREDDSYLFDLENREGDVYCIDARFYGNVSRFINHLCDPNIVPVRVFIEHWDLRFPHIAFFTSRDVKAFEELGFDYGDKFWSIKSKYFTCNCSSKLCKHAEAPAVLPPTEPAKDPEK